ncbi:MULTISPECIES: heavy-metal-associated domain-containing protein [Streptosporangium]|uniref:Copper chaperone CopZ n=1 Tax=Streptosporangium brasiliense TaxID=47480 RepID=A0ABT9RLV5_9ACTN|nr:heavy-metal-associated domain-containing protein [Streptosporangium brasiliense]MDP9870252.1 copper chaperone CopZ [Streptosporangium brasiliense]
MCTACACGTQDSASTQAAAVGADASVYTVSGMTCGHCVSSVSSEIGKVGGVTGVQVDLASGSVSVSGAGFSDEDIRAAVERAGYTPTGAAPVGAF